VVGIQDLPLIVQIRLVADEDDNDVLSPLIADIVDPLGRIEEGGAVW
jgi:hypothetical protein